MVSITHKKCSRCKEYKHRKFFVPKYSKHLRYDNLCSKCRRFLPVNQPATMAKRVAEGLMTEEHATRLRAKMFEAMTEASVAGRLENKKKRNIASWQRLVRAVKMARMVVDVYPYSTQAEHEWAHEVTQLIEEARELIDERKKTEPMPDEYVFWYDCDKSIMRRLRILIEQYPNGAGNSPITIL